MPSRTLEAGRARVDKIEEQWGTEDDDGIFTAKEPSHATVNSHIVFTVVELTGQGRKGRIDGRRILTRDGEGAESEEGEPGAREGLGKKVPPKTLKSPGRGWTRSGRRISTRKSRAGRARAEENGEEQVGNSRLYRDFHGERVIRREWELSNRVHGGRIDRNKTKSERRGKVDFDEGCGGSGGEEWGERGGGKWVRREVGGFGRNREERGSRRRGGRWEEEKGELGGPEWRKDGKEKKRLLAVSPGRGSVVSAGGEIGVN